MLEQIKYINHRNEELEFGKESLYANANDLRDFVWNVVSKNNRISGFTRGVITKSLPVVIACRNEEAGLKIRNKLFEIAEKDVLALQHGKLLIGDYYLKCYITGSKKGEYLKSKRSMNVDLTISTDYPYWVKETTTTFNYWEGSLGTNLDYNRDFPSDYTSNLIGKQLNNTDFVPSNFRLNFYGICENPSVIIGGHEYAVNVSVGANEYLTVDSIEKTIVLTHTDGTKENCFNFRNRDSYIFEKMPSGISNVAGGNFKFDITLLEERSEPKWI